MHIEIININISSPKFIDEVFFSSLEVEEVFRSPSKSTNTTLQKHAVTSKSTVFEILVQYININWKMHLKY